jgi:lipopolysaccharide biosynthesis glycosyltransferase
MIDALVVLHGNNDVYIKAFAALYASLRLHSAAALRFHVAYDSSVNISSLERLVVFISERDKVNLLNMSDYPHVSFLCSHCSEQRFSPAVLWRVFAAELLQDLSRVLILDADLIFLCDIAKIWDVCLGDQAIAAVLRGRPWPRAYHRLIATPPSQYFRIGLSLLNLDYMRSDLNFQANRENFLLTTLPQANALVCLPEQSVFNYFFSHSVRPLDVALVSAGYFDVDNHDATRRVLSLVRSNKDLVLDLKGWNNRSPFDYFYWTHLLLTPWQEEAYRALCRHQEFYAAMANSSSPEVS